MIIEPIVTITQYQIERHKNWLTLVEKYENLVKQVALSKSNILLLPEYAGLEIVSFCGGSQLFEQFSNLQSYLSSYLEIWQKLAIKYKIYIQPGTIPVATHKNTFYNRAYFFSPRGICSYQDKINLTRAEINSEVIESSFANVQIFDTCYGKIAIAICYDVEFPSLVHKMVAEGANLILVPSCTDNVFGYYRVSLSCRARAIENQCFVVNSCLVGEVEWCEFVDVNCGLGGVYSPIDKNFPDDGILLRGLEGIKGFWHTPSLSFKEVNEVRKAGSVSNFFDNLKFNSGILSSNLSLF